MKLADLLPPILKPTYCDLENRNSNVDLKANEIAQRYLSDVRKSAPGGDFESRFVRTCQFLVAFINQIPDLHQKTALEVGCGRGAKAVVLSQFFKQYVGIDIAKSKIELAKKVSSNFKITNIDFIHDEAANIEHFLSGYREKFDVIILYAILEHLTIEEKINLLRCCWEYLNDDSYLFIGEAPNRMVPVDYHSSKMLYFQQMPIDLWKEYYNRSPNRFWVDKMNEGEKKGLFTKTAYRRGLHVGHQEFDLAIKSVEELKPHIFRDNFANQILNLYPYEGFEFAKLLEQNQIRTFPAQVMVAPRDLPDFFSRYYLEVVLKKCPVQKKALSPVNVIAPRGQKNHLNVKPIGFGDVLKAGECIKIGHDDLIAYPSDQVSISIVVRPPESKGEVEVLDKKGNILFCEKIDTLVQSIAKYRQNITFTLPKISSNLFPINIRPAKRSKTTISWVILR